MLPFHKNGDKSECSNYRGISLLNIAFKILEAIIVNRFKRFRDKVTREEQCGFRPGRSTIDQIFNLRCLLQNRHEYRRPTMVAFIDFKAAFDSVHRPTLYKLLAADGMSPKLVNMIKLLYEPSRSCVKINNSYSDTFDIHSGVRQGSILSPTLFNYCVDWVMEQALEEDSGVIFNNLEERFTDGDYADDIAVNEESEERMQCLMDRIDRYGRKIGLHVSAPKTKIMQCCISKIAKIYLDGGRPENVKCFNYLGSTISETGGIDREISCRIAKARSAFCRLNNLWRSEEVTLRTKMHIYNAAIRSVLLYGSNTWPAKMSDIKQLEVFENYCRRRILGITKSDRISNRAICARTGHTTPLVDMLKFQRLSLLGHILRMGDDRNPRRLFTARPPKDWKRPRGRAFLTWSKLAVNDVEPFFRHVSMRRWKANSLEEIAEVAANRSEWRRICNMMASAPPRVGVS